MKLFEIMAYIRYPLDMGVPFIMASRVKKYRCPLVALTDVGSGYKLVVIVEEDNAYNGLVSEAAIRSKTMAKTKYNSIYKCPSITIIKVLSINEYPDKQTAEAEYGKAVASARLQYGNMCINTLGKSRNDTTSRLGINGRSNIAKGKNASNTSVLDPSRPDYNILIGEYPNYAVCEIELSNGYHYIGSITKADNKMYGSFVFVKVVGNCMENHKNECIGLSYPKDFIAVQIRDCSSKNDMFATYNDMVMAARRKYGKDKVINRQLHKV